LTLGERLQILACIVERRSKGKLFVTIDRITQEKKTLRNLYLDVTNAGQDDGLPTSVLREISHLKCMDHPNIVKIEHAEVQNALAQMVYHHYDFNLKEYMKQKNSNGPLQCQKIKQIEK